MWYLKLPRRREGLRGPHAFSYGWAFLGPARLAELAHTERQRCGDDPVCHR
jgi:hypothetical protein